MLLKSEGSPLSNNSGSRIQPALV